VPSAEPTVGERFARSLLSKDWEAMAAVLDPGVEQTAYYDTQDNRITKLRILCSGFLPVARRDHS
jgi:hypothetical protein